MRDLARFGLSDDEIARVCLIGPRTLRKHYGAELGAGRTTGRYQAGHAPVWNGRARGKSAIAAQTFWLIARAKWTAPVLAEPADNKYDASNPERIYDLTDEELMAIQAPAGLESRPQHQQRPPGGA